MYDYQLTKQEWHDKTSMALRQSNEHLKLLGFSGETKPDMSRHYFCVKNAIESDKIVPKAVLEDYPDLLDQYTKIRKAWGLPLWQAGEA